MICKNCGSEINENVRFCQVCGCKVENVNNYTDESSSVLNTQSEQTTVVSQPLQNDNSKRFCQYCGNEITGNNNYCSVCGISTEDENKIHCTKCGAELDKNQKYCNICGTENINLNVLKKTENKLKKLKTDKSIKNKVVVIVAVLLLCTVSVTALSFIVPKIFISTESLLAEGKYEEAYKKANSKSKDLVLIENIVANSCKDYKSRLKNPDSFKLLEFYFSTYDDGSISIVIKTSGTNSYGGVVSGYELYKYYKTTNTCEYRGSKSSSNDEHDYIDVIIETIVVIDESLNFYSDDAKIEMIDRINKLNESGLLEKVAIIDQVKNLNINKTKEEMSS